MAGVVRVVERCATHDPAEPVMRRNNERAVTSHTEIIEVAKILIFGGYQTRGT